MEHVRGARLDGSARHGRVEQLDLLRSQRGPVLVHEPARGGVGVQAVVEKARLGAVLQPRQHRLLPAGVLVIGQQPTEAADHERFPSGLRHEAEPAAPDGRHVSGEGVGVVRVDHVLRGRRHVRCVNKLGVVGEPDGRLVHAHQVLPGRHLIKRARLPGRLARALHHDHPVRAQRLDVVSDPLRGGVPIDRAVRACPGGAVRLVEQVDREDVPLAAQAARHLRPAVQHLVLRHLFAVPKPVAGNVLGREPPGNKGDDDVVLCRGPRDEEQRLDVSLPLQQWLDARIKVQHGLAFKDRLVIERHAYGIEFVHRNLNAKKC